MVKRKIKKSQNKRSKNSVYKKSQKRRKNSVYKKSQNKRRLIKKSYKSRHKNRLYDYGSASSIKIDNDIIDCMKVQLREIKKILPNVDVDLINKINKILDNEPKKDIKEMIEKIIKGMESQIIREYYPKYEGYRKITDDYCVNTHWERYDYESDYESKSDYDSD